MLLRPGCARKEYNLSRKVTTSALLITCNSALLRVETGINSEKVDKLPGRPSDESTLGGKIVW